MPVAQVTEPCWLASFDGDERKPDSARFGGHYAAGKLPSGRQNFHNECAGLVFDGYCTTCTDRVPVDRTTLRVVVPLALTGCWEITCDVCETEFEDDEVGGVHFGSFDEAARAGYDWHVYEEGCGHGGDWEEYPQSGMCSEWAVPGDWHWALADVRPLGTPVPCKGSLGLWKMPEDVEQAVREQLAGREGEHV